MEHIPGITLSAGAKTVVVKSPAASPVGVTYDFVMKPPEPTDLLVVAPQEQQYFWAVVIRKMTRLGFKL